MNKLRQYFPTFNTSNLGSYYLISLFNNGWFVMGNWLFFWLKYMTISEVGIFDAIAFGIGMLLEIPTGAIADLFGKKNTLLFARLMATSGALLMALGTDKWMMLIGNILVVGSWSFFSGAGEALAYDSLVEVDQRQQFARVISKINLLAIAGTAVTSAIGGLLYMANDRFPWYAWVIFNFISLLLCLRLKEPRLTESKLPKTSYLAQLISGFKELLKPSLRYFFLAFFALSGIFYLYETGFIRLSIAASFGFDGAAQSFISAFVTLVAAVSVAYLVKLRNRISDEDGIILLLLIMGISFAFAALEPTSLIGIGVIMGLAVSGNFATPFISIIVNHRIDSEHRATALSTLAFFTKLPYVVIAILAGSIIQSGNLSVFSGVLALILLITAVSTYALLSKQKQSN